MITCDLYGRVSTTEQAKEGYSIGEQEERLRKYAEAQGWIINAVYMDAGFSGSNLNREGIQNVIKDAQAHKINKVVVYKLDRLSRSQRDTLYLIEDVFNANGVDFVSMTESFSSGTSFGRATLGLMSVFAQLERESITERMTIGHEARVKSGKYHAGGHPPTGYYYANGRLNIEPYEAEKLKWIFNEFANGATANSIAVKLRKDNFKRNDWCSSNVYFLLKNPLYIGYQRYKGELYKLIDFEPIIEEELFERCQDIIARRQKDTVKPQTAHRHVTLLGGIIWCGVCGARMIAIADKNVKGERIYRYYCNNRYKASKGLHGGFKCGNKSYRSEELNELVIAELRKVQVVDDRIETEDNNTEENKNAIRTKIKAIESKLDKMIDLYTSGRFDIDTLNNRVDSLTEEKAKLIKELEQLETPKGTLTHEEAVEQITSFSQLIDKCSSDYMEIYDYVHALIRSVTVEPEELTIMWNVE